MVHNDPIARSRMDLLYEEVAELLDALQSGDLAEIGGEACDVIYSVYAIAEANGLDLDPFWERIQEANMLKEPNANGKPTKGPGWEKPDLKAALRQVKEGSSRIPFHPPWARDLRRLAATARDPLLRADLMRVVDRHTRVSP